MSNQYDIRNSKLLKVFPALRIREELQKFFTIKKMYLFIFFMAVLLLFTVSASAHKVTVFAWVEGDMVYVESKFSGGKKVRGGEVIVSDPSETRQFIKGKTNNQGEFSFKIPDNRALKIVVMAGMGHRGEWIIPLEEIGEAEETETFASPKPVANEPEKAIQAISAPVPVLMADIQLAMEKSLDNKLKPVIKMLNELRQDQKPSVTDIFGGIGYIFGLAGVAAYFNCRRKKSP
ncbi:hypothetical protein [Desulfonema magnum]|uniref:Nickel transport protein n=1 Tax=Desulfonema magnum TaxID=45655 RepID=A0A975BKP7_9BACT|nr:hypothetical protein [Desulfonema magnum]QTA86844.1 Uncharacterized protein dnm_028680 [Desulfonema magnum]